MQRRAKPNRPQPNWQPAARLPLIAELITGIAGESAAQLANLGQVAGRPGALDDATVSRVIRVYGQQQDGLRRPEEQLRRWLPSTCRSPASPSAWRACGPTSPPSSTWPSV